MNRTVMIHTPIGQIYEVPEKLFRAMMVQILTYPLVGHTPEMDHQELVSNRQQADKIVRHLDKH